MKKILATLLLIGVITLSMYFLYLYTRAPPQATLPPTNNTLSLVIEPDDGSAPVSSMITHATKSINLVMYDFEDTAIESELVVAEERGVQVHVLLNKGYYGAQSPMNSAAYAYLEEHHVAVRWASASFALTHEKLLIADDDSALIMGFNFTPKYYQTSRDFGVADTDPRDLDELERVFEADWSGKSGTTSQGDGAGSDLVWSPHAEPTMLSLIRSATSSILIYNEEMSDKAVIQELMNAAQRGVSVSVIMTYQSTWKSALLQLAASGVHLRIYPAKASIYIHAKAVIVDQKVAFVGSQNFSATSLNVNRELGIMVTKPIIISALVRTFGTDWSRSDRL